MNRDPVFAAGAPTPGVGHVDVVRHDGGQAIARTDVVIDEQPVALVYNGLSHVVMMATPLDLEDFALGFSLSEGLLNSVDEVRDLVVQPGAMGTTVQLQVSPRAFARFKDRRRHLAGRTGCGLCGMDSLQAFHEALPASSVTQRSGPLPGPVAVARAFAALPALQPLQAQTGGCHAAAWSNPQGEIQLVREDVGRHNALDKLIGALVRHGPVLPEGFALVSSRASHEMVSKCIRMSVGTLAAISAPTSLGVDLARRGGLQLFGFCRSGTAVQYA